MAFTYEQISGRMLSATGVIGVGYSGFSMGKNNPDMQEVRNVGPIPCGMYTIEAPVDSPKHGKFSMLLVPDLENQMHGRDEFLIHGDSIDFPGRASQGCIIISRWVRELIWNSGDHRLQVVRELLSAG